MLFVSSKECVLDQQSLFKCKLLIGDMGNKVEQLDKGSRLLTIVSRYPKRWHCYIWLISMKISEIICEWIGLVPNCVPLNAATLEVRFCKFKAVKDINIVYQSDKEGESSAHKTVTSLSAVRFDATDNNIDEYSGNEYYDQYKLWSLVSWTVLLETYKRLVIICSLKTTVFWVQLPLTTTSKSIKMVQN